MKTKIAVGLLTALTLLFVVLALWSALAFILADNWIANVIGWCVVGIVVLGIWSLVRELRFGMNTEKLARILHDEGLARRQSTPHPRAYRPAAADQEFETYRAETQADPTTGSWYRLGLASTMPPVTANVLEPPSGMQSPCTSKTRTTTGQSIRYRRNKLSNGPRTPNSLRTTPKAMTIPQWTNSHPHIGPSRITHRQRLSPVRRPQSAQDNVQRIGRQRDLYRLP